MSKSLKKLIDINRLREFKNKLVGTGSAYVQTGAVDQTVAGTKTFSKPIVGSVTGSSGSCTGNAATATTATTAEACTGNAATATKLATARSLWGNSFDGSAAISGIITGTPGIELMPAATSNHGGVIDFHYNHSTADYTSRIIESDSGTLSINSVTITTGKVTATTFNGALEGNVTGNCSGSSGSCTGNAATATNASKFNGLVASDFARTTGNVNQTITGTKTFNSPINSPVTTGTWINGNSGVAIINSTANAGYNVLFRMKSSHGVFTGCAYDQSYQINYTTDSIVNAGTNATTYTNTLIDENGNATFSNNITVRGTINGNLTGNAATATTATTAQACTGNADTATKLATARTIALSGAATGTATVFDGSGNITIPVTALASSAIRAQWYAAYPDGAEAHNAMWGGRDITAAFNNGTVSANIANGTFRDIFPGDYITKAVTIYGNGTPGKTYTVNWVIADCDYWINKGDTATTIHHVAIVPQQPIFDANMNATNTTEGGYKGSVMYRSIIKGSVTGGIVSAFGSDHILTFRDLLTRDLNTSAVSSGVTTWTGAPNWNGAWYSQQCNLMSEAMVYGGPHCASSALDNIMATRQMSAFRLSEKLINYSRQHWWLRDVVSSAYFAVVDGPGFAGPGGASDVCGVRPFALLV